MSDKNVPQKWYLIHSYIHRNKDTMPVGLTIVNGNQGDNDRAVRGGDCSEDGPSRHSLASSFPNQRWGTSIAFAT